jgi:hypothetical protein
MRVPREKAIKLWSARLSSQARPRSEDSCHCRRKVRGIQLLLVGAARTHIEETFGLQLRTVSVAAPLEMTQFVFLYVDIA